MRSHRPLPSMLVESEQEIYDVAVIGGGVVGLAVAREAQVRGFKTILLEREDTVAAGASSGNSGLGCTGYDAPVGSLERHLLRRSIRRHPALYRSFGLSSVNHQNGHGVFAVVDPTPELHC
jgi:glycerol-3-phosphate dehydrogenase